MIIRKKRYIFRRRNTESLPDARIAGYSSSDEELIDYGIALFLEATNTSWQRINTTQVVN